MGKWLEHTRMHSFLGGETVIFYMCSECGMKHNNQTPHCPWCGEEMEKSEGDDDDR